MKDITPLKAEDVLGEMLPLTAYYDAFARFALWAVPLLLLGFGGVLGLMELYRRDAPAWVVALFSLLVLAALMTLAFAYFAWREQVVYFDHLKLTRFQVQMTLAFAMQNSITGMVEVKGRNNTVTMTQGQAVTVQTPDVAGGQVYEVALQIAETAIRSWNLNNGKRATPKPISAKAMGDALGIGGETWQDAIDLLDGAGVTQNAGHATQWKVIINNMRQAEDALFREMVKRGYASYKQDGRQYWHKVTPTLPANV